MRVELLRNSLTIVLQFKQFNVTENNNMHIIIYVHRF